MLQTPGTTKANNYLNGKNLIVLINQNEVHVDEETNIFGAIKKTGLYWLPANYKAPTSTTFVYQRTEAFTEGPQVLDMFYAHHSDVNTYLELPETLISTSPYQNTSDTTTVSHFTFQLNRNLKV
jgi:hypothetical protein